MEASDILLALQTAFIATVFGALWIRLGKVEASLANKVDREDFRAAIATMESGFRDIRSELAATRIEVTQVRSDVTQVRSDLNQVRSDLTQVHSDLNSGLSQVHSDLTHVALAVGARPPKAAGDSKR